jgi:hypothetical protein
MWNTGGGLIRRHDDFTDFVVVAGAPLQKPEAGDPRKEGDVPVLVKSAAQKVSFIAAQPGAY